MPSAAPPLTLRRTPNIGNYEDRRVRFDWRDAERELLGPSPGPLNIGWLCTDRICALGHAQKPALLWENSAGVTRTYTFDDLRRATNTVAKSLQDLGIQPGDRVCLFLDRVPELYVAFLGILKLGAIVQPLFSAFGEEALQLRIADAASTAVITQMRHLPKVRRARGELPTLRHVIVVDAGSATLREGETSFDLSAAPPVERFDAYPCDRETPSVLHYTSGTTGKPKGALHVHGSIIAQHITARWVLDLQENDIYWCTADPGWVTGTSYGIIGAWSNGATQFIYDGGFSAERWYTLIEKYRITVWYSAPTAIRMLMREGEELARSHDLGSLRHLVSVGEPLAAEAVTWSERAFGLPFHDSFWQTETGCIVISNYPGMKIKPGSMGRPFPGIIAAVLDPRTYQAIETPGRVGLIALRPGWPSMMRTYWNNSVTYYSKFRNGWYLTGDRASIDADGYYWFVGRDDDVINTGGHLVGPFEIEGALLEHPAVAESAAVGKPDPVNYEVVKAFVVLKPDVKPSTDLELEIMNFVRKRVSPLAMPQEIEFVASVPRTRSGKILRRVLRAQEWGEPIGDLSTLEND
ncbi:MAG: acetate--CoA ligase [Phycisphaerae bacterium]|jgi:acetyl-CoA synthetase